MNEKINAIAQVCLAGEQINEEQIDVLLAEAGTDFFGLVYWANKIRENFFGNKIRICSIVPGRLGGCNQDCKFCAQSARYETAYRQTQILTDEEILNAAEQAKLNNVPNFGIVYSGKTVSEEELIRLENLIGQISELGLKVCASLGVITEQQAGRLVKAGLTGYNHNLETSERHFGNIVTTHEYRDRVKTIQTAQKSGLKICAGGIFGIGESDDDRVQMALELRKLKVDTVPMNFLHPIKGTPLGELETLQPKEILRIIALYRFILPQTTLKVAGGRVLNLRDLQSWIFCAGANAILSGNYLTTAGRCVEEDMQMLADLGLQPQLD
ncbi:MAG: biotin synthase BioB [Planctomycetes bacterium]|nr:biotin synthase BioB [Planctomycetota bacterium]